MRACELWYTVMPLPPFVAIVFDAAAPERSTPMRAVLPRVTRIP